MNLNVCMDTDEHLPEYVTNQVGTNTISNKYSNQIQEREVHSTNRTEIGRRKVNETETTGKKQRRESVTYQRIPITNTSQNPSKRKN